MEMNNKNLAIGGGLLLLVLIVVFAFGKTKGKSEKEVKNIDVKVNIKDEKGQTIVYDPNPLLERLNKGLTTTYFFNSTLNTERCAPIEELYKLDSVRFMAAVRAYEVKYGISLLTHMNGVYTTCSSLSEGNYFKLIPQRFNNLKDLIK